MRVLLQEQGVHRPIRSLGGFVLEYFESVAQHQLLHFYVVLRGVVHEVDGSHQPCLLLFLSSQHLQSEDVDMRRYFLALHIAEQHHYLRGKPHHQSLQPYRLLAAVDE